VADGETGLLIPPRDAKALSSAMLEILQRPELAARFGKAGRERVMKHFSLESTVRRTEQLYWNLIENRKGRHVQDIPDSTTVT